MDQDTAITITPVEHERSINCARMCCRISLVWNGPKLSWILYIVGEQFRALCGRAAGWQEKKLQLPKCAIGKYQDEHALLSRRRSGQSARRPRPGLQTLNKEKEAVAVDRSDHSHGCWRTCRFWKRNAAPERPRACDLGLSQYVLLGPELLVPILFIANFTRITKD